MSKLECYCQIKDHISVTTIYIMGILLENNETTSEKVGNSNESYR